MFRLLKLALYAVMGYALYQMYLGFTEAGERRDGGDEGQATGRDSARRLRAGQNITGAGRGVSARTDEPSGTSAQHRVGRGIVS